ncbi:hypothetical protein JCM10450v2_001040 [Rhodotorula kratochvilovae]
MDPTAPAQPPLQNLSLNIQHDQPLAKPATTVEEQLAAYRAKVAQLEATLKREQAGAQLEAGPSETANEQHFADEQATAAMRLDAAASPEERKHEDDKVAVPVWDGADSVYRCTSCFYEVAYGRCESCGQEFERDDGMQFADNELKAANLDNDQATADDLGADAVHNGDSRAQLLALGYSDAMIARYQLSYSVSEHAVIAVADEELWDTFAPFGMVQLAVEMTAQADDAAVETSGSTEMDDTAIAAGEEDAISITYPTWRIHLPLNLILALSVNDHDGREYLLDHVDDLVAFHEEPPRTAKSLGGAFELDVVTLADSEGGFVTRRTREGEVGELIEGGSGELVLVSRKEGEEGVVGPLFKPFDQESLEWADDDKDGDFEERATDEESTDGDAPFWNERHAAIERDEDRRRCSDVDEGALEGDAEEEDVEMA